MRILADRFINEPGVREIYEDFKLKVGKFACPRVFKMQVRAKCGAVDRELGYRSEKVFGGDVRVRNCYYFAKGYALQ